MGRHRCGNIDAVLTPPQHRALIQLARCLREQTPSRLDPAAATALPDALVRRHFLAPLAYRAGVERFRDDFIASALLAELRERTSREVVAALAADGIPVILLKGISYARLLYAEPAERPMSDVDLLVPPDMHDAAARVLRRLGYWVAGSPRQRSPLHHAVGFKRKGASIDLHRSMIQPLRARIDVAGLWQRAVPAPEVDSQPDGPLAGHARRLDPVDEAVIHLGHIARHELLVPIINYVDAVRLMRRVPGAPDAVRTRAREFRLGRAVHAALAMTDALTRGGPDCSPPPAPMPALAEVLAYRPVWRPLQFVRKAWLVEGPVELIGLAVVGTYGHLAHRLRA